MTQTKVKMKNGTIKLPKKLSNALNGAEFLVIEDDGKLIVSGPMIHHMRNQVINYTKSMIEEKEKTLKILKKTFGSWKGTSSGVTYENKIRKEAETHFNNL